MRLILTFLSMTIHFSAFAGSHTTVTAAQFQVGNTWTWTYSELSRTTGEWTPYLLETYRITESKPPLLTFEMSSSGGPGIFSEAHHKFIVDFSRCESAALDSKKKNFHVEFLTKSYGNGWQVVSKYHKNLVFTEKFNCAGPITPAEFVTEKVWSWQSQPTNVFTIDTKAKKETSWYFLAVPGLEGVAAYKLFEPKQDYKFELTSYCDQGLACP